MDSDNHETVPPDSSLGGATEQATQDTAERTLLSVASEPSVQASLVAGAQNVQPQTATDDVQPDAASATPDEETSGAEEGANPQASDSPSTPPPGDMAAKDDSDLVDDQQKSASTDQQAGFQIVNVTEELFVPERFYGEGEPDGVVLNEGNAAGAATHFPHRSISKEETVCTHQSKVKTSAICEKCDIKTRVASIQETCKDTEQLEEELETTRKKYVKNARNLITAIEVEEMISEEKINEQRDAELQKLNDAYDKRIEELQKRCREKIEHIEEQIKDRLQDIDSRQSDSRAARESATTMTQEWTSLQEGMQLTQLKEAIDGGAASFASKMKDIKDVLTDWNVHLMPAEDNEDIEEHGDFRARVVLGSYQSKEQQTVLSGSLHIKDLQARVAALTKKTPKEYWEKQKKGDVAVKFTSITQNRQYAQGKRQTPVPIEAPDSNKPQRWANLDFTDLVLVSVEEAEELAALVGGGSDVKYNLPPLRLVSQKTSQPAFLYVFMVNKAENKKTIEERKAKECRGYHYFLPVNARLRDCVLKARSLPASTPLKSYDKGNELFHSLTVGEWGKEHKGHTILY